MIRCTPTSTSGGICNGGASYKGTLNHCTLTGNSADFGGGGSSEGTLNNCIVLGETNNSTLNSCFTDLDGDPQFVDAANGDYRLLATSPCINAGNNSYVVDGDTDLDGNPRILGGTVDQGAFEFQNGNVDGDTLSDYAEYILGSDPLSESEPFCVTLDNGQVNVNTCLGRTYTLMMTTDLTDPDSWTPVATCLGTSEENPLSDPDEHEKAFYKIEVKITP